MNRDWFSTGIIVLMVVLVIPVFLSGLQLIVLFATLLFLIGTFTSWRSMNRSFYSFIFAIPLVVSVGGQNLMYGVVVLSISLGLLIGDDISGMSTSKRGSFVFIPIIILLMAVLVPTNESVMYLFLAIVLISAGGFGILTVQNRRWKEHYSKESL